MDTPNMVVNRDLDDCHLLIRIGMQWLDRKLLTDYARQVKTWNVRPEGAKMLR